MVLLVVNDLIIGAVDSLMLRHGRLAYGVVSVAANTVRESRHIECRVGCAR